MGPSTSRAGVAAVEGAALLERGGELQVLELQEHLAAGDGREGSRRDAGGVEHLAVQALGGGTDVSED
jgi:hypothetical protein